MAKLLTIVIPAYNSEMTINATLLSLDYQLGKYFDVLIIDDGSTKPLQPFIQPWIDRFPNIIRHVRTKNNNWGGCVNYAIQHVKTKYLKILDSDDVFFTKNLHDYFKNLEVISKTNTDAIISSFILNDIKTRNLMKRYYNIKKGLVYSDFDNLHFTRILTMHALTWKVSLLKKIKPLPINTAYTDNLLMFRTILQSKKVALLPRDIFIYDYKFGDVNQSMSWIKILKNLSKLKDVYHDMLKYPIKNLSKKRTKLLTNSIKQMFYFICLIISLDNDTYAWQKKKQVEIQLGYIEEYSMKNRIGKIINTGYLRLINRRSIPFILQLNKLVMFTSQAGFLKLFKLQYKEGKHEKIRTQSSK